MNNIFEGAKFGDKFLTRDGKIAIYNCYVDKPLSREGSHHELIIQEASGIYDFSDNGKDIYFEEPCINDIVSKYQEPIDDKSVYFWLRNKTACGLTDAKNYINELIRIIRSHHIYRTDSKLELVYKEPIDDNILNILANNHCLNTGYSSLDEDDYINDETLTWKDIMNDIRRAYKTGYRKAKEE